MPSIRELLKKKERIGNQAQSVPSTDVPIPEFKFFRTTTEQQEEIKPPGSPLDDGASPKGKRPSDNKKHLAFRKSANAAFTKDPTARTSLEEAGHNSSEKAGVSRPKSDRRLSERLHLGSRSRSKSDVTSDVLPHDLGEAPPLPSISAVHGTVDTEERTRQEARWEKRATILATTSSLPDGGGEQHRRRRSRSRSPSISNARNDVNIQEAITLHEAGDLPTSTRMFGRLADPLGANNALSQVLYGLALRHGWGIEVDHERAIHYLSLAAQNSAAVEKQALASGLDKGGAAKGELVLAIFELANCLRNGWGVKKDPVAARHYYETAANLGDIDSMEEAAWCYLEGFGGAKDKFKAAQYLRLAEKTGSKSVGNSWIWKDKYNPK